MLANKTALILLFFFLFVFPASSQDDADSRFSIGIAPGLSIPLGDATEIFTLGGGADIVAQLRFPLLPNLDVRAIVDLGYNLSPVQADTSTSTITIGGGSGIFWEFVPRLTLGGYARGGYFYSLLNDTSGVPEGEDQTGGGNLFFGGGLSFAYRLLPTFSLGLDASYRNLLDLRSNMVVALAATYHLPSGGYAERYLPLKGIEFYDQQLETVFPVFFKYYDDHPVGSVSLRNRESVSLEDIKVSFFVEEHMINPKLCKAPEKLGPGEEAKVELYGLFTDSVLGISESTKVSAKITVECTKGGKEYRNEYIETLRLHDRNAMTWDDDRKAAAFVSTKDPTVLKFSKAVAGAIKGKASKAIDSSLLTAMAMHEALNLYGMSYVVDPSTPYKEFSKDAMAVDYLQFSKQTLEYKAGDCDDLSILYCALLESIGVETAFITVPGHIYAAVALDVTSLEAKRHFQRPENLINAKDKIWLPVEVTIREEGFLKAWEEGARQWREFDPAGQAKLYPLHEAWGVYEAVGFSSEPAPIALPEEQKLVRAFSDEISTFVQREISSRVAELEDRIRRSGNSVRLINKMAVLYARYGLNDQAREQLEKVLRTEEYMPTLVNMGNLYYQDSDYSKALEYYTRAYNRKPDSLTVLLCMARTNHATENYGSASRYYQMLKAKSPEFAEKFAYLDLKGKEADRAAASTRAREVILWEEE